MPIPLCCDGSLWAWGWNKYGQLGDGTTTKRLTPVKVMDNVRKVSAGNLFTMAIRNDGSLWSFGANSIGQLGDCTLENRIIPVKVADGIKAISCGTTVGMVVDDEGYLLTNGEVNYH